MMTTFTRPSFPSEFGYKEFIVDGFKECNSFSSEKPTFIIKIDVPILFRAFVVFVFIALIVPFSNTIQIHCDHIPINNYIK